MPNTKLSQYKALLFDCYGTLVDWEDGLYTALLPILLRSKPALASNKVEALTAFLGLENDLQARYPTMLYKDILAHCHAELAARLHGEPSRPEDSQSVAVTELSAHPGGTTTAEITTAGSSAFDACASNSRGLKEEDIAFGRTIANWRPFPDTIPALFSLSRHYKLAVLSNVDHESFQQTRAVLERSDPQHQFGFDAVYTAQDIGSYKPNEANFEYALKRLKEDFGIEKDDVLVTAASLFHDHAPANALGIRSVYIARPGAVLGRKQDATYDWKFESLAEMAEEVEREGLRM